MLPTPNALLPGCDPPNSEAAGGGPLAAEALVISYIPLVKGIAARIRELMPSTCGVEFSDLAQAGYIGLIQAAQSYDVQSPVAFSFYARFRIRGAILDMLRGLDGASRRFRHWKKLRDAVSNDLASRLHREPTREEILETCGAEDTGAWHRNLALLAHSLLNQNQLREEPGGSPETRPDTICARRQVRHLLGRALGTLPERSRKILFLYYENDLTMRQIACILSVNESRVSQMHKSALRAMEKKLRSSGIRRGADLRART